MAELNGGRLLARCLANEGVRFVFGLPSPEIDPLLAALGEHGIRLVPFRHEAAGAHMAEGLYKTTGQVAVVIGNPGPGSANLLAGVITARHEGVPLVAITSQHRLGIVYPSPPSTFQGQDQLDVYKPVVKWSGPIFSWERIPEVVRLAFREMWTGRPGPVHIELPAPVLYATGDASSVRVPPPAAYRAPLPEASDARITEIADLLAGAARPLVIAGSGGDRAGANEVLLAIVERLGCPVLTSMAGRAVVPLDHPNAVYGLGAGGDLAKREADVVLVAGSRLGNLDLPYDKYWGDPATQRVVQIDIDPRHIGVTRSQRRALQVAEHVHFTTWQGFGVHQPRRPFDGEREIEAAPVGRGTVGARQQRLAAAATHHAVRQHQPDLVRGGRARDRCSRRYSQAIEHRAAVDYGSRRGRVVQNDDQRRRLMLAAAAHRHEGPGGGQDDHDDQRGAEQEQQQMAELQPSRALPLRLAQVAERWEIELRRRAALEQMKQRRDRRGGEAQQCQRMEETHVSRRKAMPNGKSVCTW